MDFTDIFVFVCVCVQLTALVDPDAAQSSGSINMEPMAHPGPSCCNFRRRPGNGTWISKLPTYISQSMSHVLLGTKLNWLLLCVPFAIIGAQGVFGHVSIQPTTPKYRNKSSTLYFQQKQELKIQHQQSRTKNLLQKKHSPCTQCTVHGL